MTDKEHLWTAALSAFALGFVVGIWVSLAAYWEDRNREQEHSQRTAYTVKICVDQGGVPFFDYRGHLTKCERPR